MDYSGLKAVKPLFVSNRVGDELILVPLTSDVRRMTDIFTLNETGGYIWDHLDDTLSLDEMAEKIATHFSISPEQAEQDLVFFIDKVGSIIPQPTFSTQP